MKKVIKMVAVVSLLALAALCFDSFGNKPASAQMVVQQAYSTVLEATVTVSSSSVTTVDTTQKSDRRGVILANIGTNDAWCGTSSTVAVNDGFLLVAASNTYTSVSSTVFFPYTAAVNVYCKAAVGASARVHIAQVR